jgi:hypothetical protein
MNHFLRLLSTLFLSAYTMLGMAQNGARACDLSVVVDSTHASAPQAQDGSVNAIATGGAAPYTYHWYTGETTQSRINLGTGIYCVTLTDANGCTASDCSRVSAPGCESFVWGISFSANSALSTMDDVSAITNSGTEPYSYTWSNGASTPSINNVPNGIYCVTITDALNCSGTACAGLIVTDIEEHEVIGASIYPNPIRDVLHIDLANSEDAMMQLLSIEGNLLLTQNLLKGKNSIATHGIAKGMYICRISNGKVSSNKKILIE